MYPIVETLKWFELGSVYLFGPEFKWTWIFLYLLPCPSAVAPVDHVRLKKKRKRPIFSQVSSTPQEDETRQPLPHRSDRHPPRPLHHLHHFIISSLASFLSSVSLLSLSAFLSQLVSSLPSSKNIGLCFLPSREKYKTVLRSLFSGIKYTQPLLFLSQYLKLSSHHNLCSSPPEVKPACSSQ